MHALIATVVRLSKSATHLKGCTDMLNIYTLRLNINKVYLKEKLNQAFKFPNHRTSVTIWLIS